MPYVSTNKKRDESILDFVLDLDIQHIRNQMDQYRECVAVWTLSPFQRR